MTESETIQANVESILEANGITMTATSIPNRTDGIKAFSNSAMHWQICFERNGYKMAFQYSMGGAHRMWSKSAPSKWHRLGKNPHIPNKPKTGEQLSYSQTMPGLPILFHDFVKNNSEPMPPKVTDVLHSLCMDMDCLDYPFEEWAENMGMDSDSISDKNTWENSVNQSIEARSFFGPVLINELRDAVQDY